MLISLKYSVMCIVFKVLLLIIAWCSGSYGYPTYDFVFLFLHYRMCCLSALFTWSLTVQ